MSKRLSKPSQRNVARTKASPARLVAEVRTLIHDSRRFVASAVNAGLVTLYWQIGHRIRSEILKNKRAE